MYSIHKIMKDIPEDMERITLTHTLPPWQTDAGDKQYAMKLTTNPAHTHLTKGEAADKHCTRITQISQEEDYIITYTDGSMKEKDWELQTGAGWVVYWKGRERKYGCKGMGMGAEVYNAEMLALLRGLEMAIEVQQEMPNARRKRSRIVLFADNTVSVTAIMKGAPRSSQSTSQKFMETATKLLDKNKGTTIKILWVPGHMNIKGNDRADELAKEATDLELNTETTTLAKLHQKLQEKMKADWISTWANRPLTGCYAIADRMPPSLAGSHVLHT